MAKEKKKTIDIKLIIGILFLLILLIGASYAYFAVEVNSADYNKTVITGSTEGVAVVSIQNPTKKLNLNVDGSAMSLDNLGTIYADDEEDYVKTKSEGFHDIGVITLKNSKKDDNIYRCTANVTISVDNSTNSILSYLQPDDLKVFLRWGIHHEVIDLSTIKDTGKTTISISLDIVGNNSKSIETYIELTNKETDQSYLSGKDINIDIDTTDLKCELTGERAVYLTWFFYTAGHTLSEYIGHTTDIKNIYFVNYIDTTNAVEAPVDLTDKGTGKNQSPEGSIMGWLEEIPKEIDEEAQFYNLYIGSKKGTRIYDTNISYMLTNLTNVDIIKFDNFNTDLAPTFETLIRGLKSEYLDVSQFDTSNSVTTREMFQSMSLLKELDLSHFNTKNVTRMHNMFDGLRSLIKLDISNFNTTKVTTMASMFKGMSSLTELDVSSFYTGNVTDMQNMFEGLSKVKELNLSKFDTRNVTNMYRMFLNMQALEYLDLRNAEFKQVTSYSDMFLGVKNGITIIVKNEENRDWINKRLEEAGVTGNVLLPNEIN